MFDSLTKRLTNIFSGLRKKGRLSESDVQEMLREIRVALLEADVNIQVAKQFVAQIKEKAVGEEIFGSLTADQTLIKIVKDELIAILGDEEPGMRWSPAPPTVILMCGLQGSGKTTTAAKLARFLTKQGKKPMLAACDVQRPAAITQLQVLGEQVGVPVYARTDGASPLVIAREALDRAKHLFCDVLVVDTAGRLTIDEALMKELTDLHHHLKPSEVFLVLDSTTGQESVNVAQAFHDRLAVTGTIFTKLDGDTRGGAVLSVRASTGIPVRFVGLGESVETLDVMYPERMAQRIIGMGDIMGIIQKAEEAFDQQDATDMQEVMKKGQMDFHMFLTQIRMVKKMGPLKNMMKLLPAQLTNALPEDALNQVDDRHLYRLEAIMLSMTPKERSNPDIINGSRRKRIAQGSGTSVEQVNSLIKQLYEMRRFTKQAAKYEKHAKKFGKRR